MPHEISHEKQITWITRELATRRHVFSKRIEQGLMGRDTADREISTMTAIIETLERYPARDKEMRVVCKRMIGAINWTTSTSDLDSLRTLVNDLLDLIERN
jgi:hypothetical protein